MRDRVNASEQDIYRATGGAVHVETQAHSEPEQTARSICDTDFLLAERALRLQEATGSLQEYSKRQRALATTTVRVIEMYL